MACGYGACYGCVVEIDGRLAAPLRRGPCPRRTRQGSDPGRGRKGRRVILNASGCLDALTAPDVARQLDAFVTKTVTPLPREGNAPERIAETEAGMLNSIGLANPGIDRFLDDVLPRLLELGPPVWVSVGGFSADEYGDLCARLDATRRGRPRAEPLLPERRRARGRGAGDRRRGPRVDLEAPLRQALPGPSGHPGGRRGRGGGRRRRPLAREHDPRPGARPADTSAAARDRHRRALGPGSAARRARRRARLLPGDGPPDRRHGRGRDGRPRARADRGRRLRRRPRNRALRRPRRARSDPLRARGGSGRPMAWPTLPRPTALPPPVLPVLPTRFRNGPDGSG